MSVSRLRETSNILKDLKPPIYNGEEKERNKNAINTFLQKWQDFHRLKNTPPENQVVQAFLEEFLPKNKLERAWKAWDKCDMGKNTLNQYISNYRKVVLKLKDIDEFQKIRGFVRGLKDTYKVEVRRNSPKTFEEAIKFA